MLRSMESGWFQKSWGLMDPTYWESYMRSVVLIVGSPGGRVAFARNRHVFSPGFANAIDEVLALNVSPSDGASAGSEATAPN